MTSKTKLASNPEYSAAVMASAGSGKTWTLVSRMLRLLLQGADPGSLLAITFTVKAAAEMKQRLLERLEQWSYCSEEELEKHLTEIQHPITAKSKKQARVLYEQQLHAKTPSRALTFHAFFQELLSQFPHAANIPSGFELVESTFDHQELAWQQLIKEAHQNQDSSLTKQLMSLLELLGSNSTRTALEQFVNQRSDWWAWTEDYDNQEDTLEFVKQSLQEKLQPELDVDHYAEFLAPKTLEYLEIFATFFIQEKIPKTTKGYAANLLEILNGLAKDKTNNPEKVFHQIANIVLIKEGTGTPRKISASKAVRKIYGEDAPDLALEALATVAENIVSTREKVNCASNYRLNSAWYAVGQEYLNLFQQQKTQRRQLDFSDLEWKAYQLMNSSDEFSSLLSMLDDKIEHLLVDEFQDTNPTQWRFLLPLLDNFSASVERSKNIFIVGDSKQSIYGFRRANPLLLGEAATWVETQLGGEAFTENTSWRSAPEILQAVNRIFSEDGYGAEIQDYPEHTTHKNKLWGRVELWPEFTKEIVEKAPPSTEFRNPLLTPRAAKDNAFEKESSAIAKYIKKLVTDGLEIEGDNDLKRPIRYSDIQILVRKRTHVGDIERQLQALSIPFRGSSRGTFMDRLEIKDLCAMLKVLATPSDNLSLAHTLRSPLFSITSQELILIAEAEGENWYQKLITLSNDTKSDSIPNALALLEQWQILAAKLPLHDLITSIYFQGNVIERYLSAYPAWQSAQLEANLQRFVELALETNSGRYPGIHHFLARLELQASRSNQDSISEPIPGAASDAVDILTVHQAKGLESPVVFFANCTDRPKQSTSMNCIVDWAPDRERPDLIVLLPKKDNLDQHLAELHQMQMKKERQEAANILYVALTRARQLLVISGSTAQSSNTSGASKTNHAIKKIPEMSTLYKLFDEQEKEDDRIIIQSSDPVFLHEREVKPTLTITKLPKELEQAISLPAYDVEIAPSYSDESETETHTQTSSDGRLRGNIIHYFLQQLSINNSITDQALKTITAAQHSIEPNDQRLDLWLNESKDTIKKFPEYFDNEKDTQYFSELPVIYQHHQKRVFGIVDRVIIKNDEITLLDYKTHRGSNTEHQALAETFKQQLGFYKEGIALLWPEKKINCGLLFTQNSEVIWINP